MLTTSTIQQLANKYQSTELNIKREYLQHLFLSYFYTQPQTENILFKGGTALRIIYGSPRFSEDLDFSAKYGSVKMIEDCVVNTLKEIEREGLSIEISESKRTTGGYLAIIQSRIYEQVINLQTEISFRKKNISGQFATIVSDFIPSYSIMQLKKFQLVEEKIHACLERRKGRDFYDLYFLLRANMLSVENKGQLVKIQDIIKSVSVDFTKELKQFLPKSYWNVIKDFKGVLLQEIERYV